MTQTHHNHDEHHGHSHGKSAGEFRLLLAIIFNAVITIAEYIGGIFSGSLALMSDAGHNLSDVLSLILGYAGEKISSRPSDKKYSFGLKRMEVLIAVINALSLLAIAVYILYESYSRFKNPVTINIGIMLPVAVIGLAGNLFSIFALSSHRHSSINIRAAFLHLLFDAISSVAVIIAGVVLYFANIFWIDIAVSLIIVVMIIWSSSGIIRESFRIFFQGTPHGIDPDEIYSSLLNIKNVASVHGLHIWSINSNEVFLSCHILVDGEQNPIDTDSVIKDANTMLKEKYNISHTTIQIETTLLCAGGNSCCR